jgi:hypothetical protein
MLDKVLGLKSWHFHQDDLLHKLNRARFKKLVK